MTEPTPKRLKVQIVELEAEAAAMRAYLTTTDPADDGGASYDCPFCDTEENNGEHEECCPYRKALSGDAGKELLKWAEWSAMFLNGMKTYAKPPKWLKNPRKADKAAS